MRDGHCLTAVGEGGVELRVVRHGNRNQVLRNGIAVFPEIRFGAVGIGRCTDKLTIGDGNKLSGGRNAYRRRIGFIGGGIPARKPVRCAVGFTQTPDNRIGRCFMFVELKALLFRTWEPPDKTPLALMPAHWPGVAGALGSVDFEHAERQFFGYQLLPNLPAIPPVVAVVE